MARSLGLMGDLVYRSVEALDQVPQTERAHWYSGLGIVSAYWIDYGFSYVHSAAAWRTPIAIQLVFAIVVIFVIWGCPESPRWLAKRGRVSVLLGIIPTRDLH